MNLIKWLPLFILGAALESVTQISLKKGAIIHGDIRGFGYYLKLLREKWVIIGILSYVVEMAVWVILLSAIPLAIAFPLTGIQQVILILISAFIFKETISKSECLGMVLILIGIGIIARFS